MISKELLKLVLDTPSLPNEIEYNENRLIVYFRGEHPSITINTDTLGRLCKEWLKTKKIMCKSWMRIGKSGMCVVQIHSQHRELFNCTARTELAAIIKATEWVRNKR